MKHKTKVSLRVKTLASEVEDMQIETKTVVTGKTLKDCTNMGVKDFPIYANNLNLEVKIESSHLDIGGERCTTLAELNLTLVSIILAIHVLVDMADKLPFGSTDTKVEFRLVLGDTTVLRRNNADPKGEWYFTKDDNFWIVK